MLIRLNKLLSECGIASRRKAEELILQGRVSVNGKVTRTLSVKVEPAMDTVEVDGEKVRQKKHIYFLLNKPAGFVTTVSDEKKRATVVDLIKTKEKIYPVGRLDYNTTGVLLLTNDGEFTNLLTHPRNNVPRVYDVLLDRLLEQEDRTKLLKGVYIEQRRGVFNSVNFPKPKERKILEIVCLEGRNQFVKKMFGAIGYTVKRLNRKSFAGIEADIPVGEYRRLNEKEIEAVKQRYGK